MGKPPGDKGFLLYGLVFLFGRWSCPCNPLGCQLAIEDTIGRPDLTTKAIFIGYAYALVPLSLMIWVAFTLSFVLPNLLCCIGCFDPFGCGFGIREEPGALLNGWLPTSR